VHNALSLFYVEIYFRLSLSLLLWLLADVGRCISAYMVADSKCTHINKVSKYYLTDGGRHETKCGVYVYLSFLYSSD